MSRDRANPTGFYLVICAIAVSSLISRRPDAVLNPQFWAEDGTVFYASAYDFGSLRSLVMPNAGYLHTTPRLVAAFSQLFPLAWAPAIFNSFALLIQLLPVFLVVSKRFEPLIRNLGIRLLLALFYLSIPNCYEIHATITNAQWYLALLAFMVIAVGSSQFLAWKLFDAGVIFLSAFSGPFAILLLPIALLFNYFRRRKIAVFTIIELVAGACAQTVTIGLTAHRHLPARITFEQAAKILDSKVFLGALIGRNGYAMLPFQQPSFTPFAIGCAVLGLSILAYALWQAPLELKLFIVFSLLILGSSLTAVEWAHFTDPGIGGRYGFIPMIAFILALAWMLSRQPSVWRRSVVGITLSIMIIGIVLDWRHPPFADFDFYAYANTFAHLPPGERIAFTINPDWPMTLVKH